MITGTFFNRTVNNSSVTLCGGTGWDYGASITLSGKDRTNDTGDVIIRAKDNSNVSDFILRPNGTATWANKNLAMQEDVVPRIGNIYSETFIYSGTQWDNGGCIELYGSNSSHFSSLRKGYVILNSSRDSETNCTMTLRPDGTWTWNGTAVQLTSDQRLKQQISEIDDKLLDAWEDVELSQFKYNDAVDQKGGNARLHTGYVVQQINEACQKHDVDISEYGLYCHEEYPERTEEVTIDNEDGTTKKEIKVIEPAKEHYSLRYTETLVVECAYLRRENNRLKERLSKIEKLLNI